MTIAVHEAPCHILISAYTARIDGHTPLPMSTSSAHSGVSLLWNGAQLQLEELGSKENLMPFKQVSISIMSQ